MITHSFSYVGEQAENFIRQFNADILFFSCRGLTFDGKMTDVSIEEANLRRVMASHSNKKVFLCDSDKIGNLSVQSRGCPRCRFDNLKHGDRAEKNKYVSG